MAAHMRACRSSCRRRAQARIRAAAKALRHAADAWGVELMSKPVDDRDSRFQKADAALLAAAVRYADAARES